MSSIYDNKRVAKNTLLLYVRMLVLMLISFFTARVTLNALGVEDYGINNVVGGLVSLFSLFTNSMTAATSRFIKETNSVPKCKYPVGLGATRVTLTPSPKLREGYFSS